MLRQLASATLRATAPSTARLSSSAPTVFDKIVQLTVVDREGHRHVLRGLEGQTVADVLENNVELFGDDVLVTSPSKPDEFEGHIKIPSELFGTFPGSDKRALETIADVNDVDTHSRLASDVVLSRKLGDVLVSLGKVAPWKTL
ncbi:hypothetical protein QBZ16_004789 [Prototheca wickerhamii]|uniref:Uncharacterized protein n=1 Tax=Prototheca wickerhamii TaxID=3111 RepID=A0AAD9IH67_PROWI|nr:hypothetical protein QBZ16_004789 [Prototheca wickerhamii]